MLVWHLSAMGWLTPWHASKWLRESETKKKTMEYKNAIKLVGVADGTFDYWAQKVKRATGREFSRSGSFPPSRYFHS
jgi:hypothetical protein